MDDLLHDPRLRVPGIDLLRVQGIEDGPVFDWFATVLFSRDDEDHRRLRRLVASAFTPRRIDRRRPAMRAHLAALVDALDSSADPDRLEFMAALATPYPIRVMADVLGVPQADVPAISRWTEWLGLTFTLQLADNLPAVTDALLAFLDHIDRLIAQRRARPADDVLTALIEANEAADRLTDDELRVMVTNLLVAGYDTTRHQLGNLAHTFAAHPDQWALVRDGEVPAAEAVQEVFRFEPAAPGVARVVVDEFEYRGVRIPAGTIVSAATIVANRDRSVFEAPDTFDVGRTDAERNFLFGSGAHYCLGASLARAEVEVALTVLAERWSTLSLDGPVTWSAANLGLSGPTTLPLRVRWR